MRRLDFRIKLYKLCEVSAEKGTFVVDIGVYCCWEDTGLIRQIKSGKYKKLNPYDLTGCVWEPEWRFLDLVEDPLILDSTVEVFSFESATIQQYKRLRAKFDCLLQLECFPMDVQKLAVCIRVPRHLPQNITDIACSKMQTSDYKSEFLSRQNEFILDNLSTSVRYDCGMATLLRYKEVTDNLPSTFLRRGSAIESLAAEGASMNIRPVLQFEMTVHRSPSFWVNVIMFPNLGCNLVGLLALLLPPTDLSERLGLILTLILTSVGFKFSIVDRLPALPYLTMLDKWLLLVFTVYMVIALECAVVYTYLKTNPVSASLYKNESSILIAKHIDYSTLGGCLCLLLLSTANVIYTHRIRLIPTTALSLALSALIFYNAEKMALL